MLNRPCRDRTQVRIMSNQNKLFEWNSLNKNYLNIKLYDSFCEHGQFNTIYTDVSNVFDQVDYFLIILNDILLS